MHLHLTPNKAAFSSLDNSMVKSPPHAHLRTQSSSRIPPPLNFKPEHQRVPSQRKLTITCQGVNALLQNAPKENETGLKKRGVEYQPNKGKFISLQSSRVEQYEGHLPKVDKEAEYLTHLKRAFRDKLREIETVYSQSLKEHTEMIRELQLKILSNSR